jgi:hypothetical protein
MPDSFKIDAHVHVFTADMQLIDNPRHAPKYSFTHEELIATLDANGVDRAVIAAASPWGVCRRYCRRWRPAASRSWSIISAAPMRKPASIAKVLRRYCGRSSVAAPG